MQNKSYNDFMQYRLDSSDLISLSRYHECFWFSSNIDDCALSH